jgi:hypothetical protein
MRRFQGRLAADLPCRGAHRRRAPLPLCACSAPRRAGEDAMASWQRRRSRPTRTPPRLDPPGAQDGVVRSPSRAPAPGIIGRSSASAPRRPSTTTTSFKPSLTRGPLFGRFRHRGPPAQPAAADVARPAACCCVEYVRAGWLADVRACTTCTYTTPGLQRQRLPCTVVD